MAQDYDKARQWWEKAAIQGYGDAQFNLGALYYNGNGVPQDIDKAREYFAQAAAQGDEAAKEALQKLGK